ncbi:hypothetical protein KAU11_04685, partial [Candidatus Babeliales bacterium]|nr:hypothetical protein [Candidatus Babeliales bacterium]
MFEFKDFAKTFTLFAPYAVKRYCLFFCTAAVLVLLLCDIVAVSMFPFIFKRLVEQLTVGGDGAVFFAVLFSSVWIVEGTFVPLQGIISYPVLNEAIRGIKQRAVRQIHSISFFDYQMLPTGQVISAIKRISFSVRLFVKLGLLSFVPAVAKFAVSAVVVIRFGNYISGVMAFAILCSAILFTLLVRWYAAAREVSWQLADAMTVAVGDSILNGEQVRMNIDAEMKRVNSFLDAEARQWLRVNTREHLVLMAIGVVAGIAVLAAFVTSVFAVKNGSMSLGDFILFKGHIILAFTQMKSVAAFMQRLVESVVDIKKVIEILEIPREKTKFLPAILDGN